MVFNQTTFNVVNRWMMQTKGIPAGQSKWSGCVKWQTY